MLKGEVTLKFSVFRMPNTTRNLKTLHDKPRQTTEVGMRGGGRCTGDGLGAASLIQFSVSTLRIR